MDYYKTFLFFYFIFILYFLLKMKKMKETTYYQKSRKTVRNSAKAIMKITKKY